MKAYAVNFILVCMLIAAGASASCKRRLLPLPPLALGLVEYSDQVNGYRIGYPTGWIVEPKTDKVGVSFTSRSENIHPGGRTMFTVTRSSSTATPDLQKVITHLKSDYAAKYPDFTIVNESAILIGGYSGRKIVYTHTVNGRMVQLVQAFVNTDGNTYIIVAGTAPQNYAAFEPTLDSVFQSFGVTK
ncbi:MAG TPA: PsbP-related protein [Tepidisphaeraceae bacterium]|jgi:hypothetical protein|nr:PsbP-related protein [Tepidisphaeraceae bacterium]